ncbi:MAG: acetyl esterase/lipase, partial [Myxococcota bacterium]
MIGLVLAALLSTAPPAGAARAYYGLDLGIEAPVVAEAGLRVDLYLPPPSDEPPPLLVYLVGGRWTMPDARYTVGPQLADSMQRQGIATAVIRFSLADGYLLEQCRVDIARAVGRLQERAAEMGFRGDQITLGGESEGALIATLLALDGIVKPQGVIAVRGAYDLSEEALAGHPSQEYFEWVAGGAERLGALSPMSRLTHVNETTSPPFMVLYAGDDAAGYAQDGRRFARALEARGVNVEAYLVPERDGTTLSNVAGSGNRVGQLIASFVNAGPALFDIESAWGVRQRWTARRPPIGSQAFWNSPATVTSRPAPPRVRWFVSRLFENTEYDLLPYRFDEYHAVNLLEWLGTNPSSSVGSGNWLTVTNIRGEQLVLTREELQREQPQIVIGIDDEHELFRISGWYRMSQRYTWVPDLEPQPKMIRPVGAFLYFPLPRRPDRQDSTFASFGLTTSSFRWHEQDPLGPIRGLDPSVLSVLTGPSGC